LAAWKARLGKDHWADLQQWRREHRWHPNQLRHSFATKVRKVVTIATPFRGAVEAVYTMIKDNEQREAIRTLPAAYGLFPYFPGACMDISQPQRNKKAGGDCASGFLPAWLK
jgi:hypothetical protein